MPQPRKKSCGEKWDQTRMTELWKANQDCKKIFDFGIFSYVFMFEFATSRHKNPTQIWIFEDP